MNRRHFLRHAAALTAGLAAAPALPGSEPMTPYPIVDTHVHFWDPAHLRYAWLDGNALLNRPYLPEHQAEAAGPLPIDALVFVQAECLPGQAVAEAEWVARLALQDPRIAGIVACAPLELGAKVMPSLEYLARTPLVKGIRRLLQIEGDDAYCLRPEFVEGVQCLAKVGFSFDLGVTRTQLPAVTELARRCPDVRFMLDHLAFPNIRGGELDPWRQHLKDLAAQPNVFCKMSGVATSADHAHWTREQLKPYIRHALDCFGPDRTAFGSDWPVMLQATEYTRWVETLLWAVEDVSDADRRALFRDTALRFYRLEPAALPA